jgi:hypothetical protein
MKNKIFITVLLVLFSFVGSSAFSQNVYIKLGGGYGLSLASQMLYDQSATPTTTWDNKYGSFGEGINFQAGFGYNINSNFALELAGSFLLGKKFENTVGGSTTKYYANTINIMPSVVVKAPMKDITPYTRFGMILGIPSKFTEITATGFTGTAKFKESGKIAMGIQGAVGVNFKAGKHLGIFAEIFGIGMNYSPDKRENTETFTELGLLQPTVTYGETGTGTILNGVFVPATGTEQAPRYSFSSFGMNVGLTYTFGK